MSIIDEMVAPVAMLQLTDQRDACECCGDRFEDDEERFPNPDSEEVCQDCFDEECFTCEGNGSLGWRDDAVTGPDGNLYCQRYADNHFSRCDDCCEPCWADDMVGTDDGSICSSCYQNGYFTCCECDTVQTDDHYAEDGYCRECHDEHCSSNVIKPYSDKSANSLGFFGDSKDGVFFGVELEVECPNGDREELAETVQDTLGDDFAVLKEDGSLSTGFEIVTAPATLQEHAERFRELLTTDKKRGLKSWDTSSCGMHVHVSRKPLSDLTIGKILVLMNDRSNQTLIAQVAGRSDVHWCKISDKKISDAHSRRRYDGSNSDRYSAVNITLSKTIEFRIFKGTLKYEGFLKNLEFVRSVVTFCRTAGIQELTAEKYLAHVSSRKKEYPNLVAFLRTKHFLPSPARRPLVASK